MSSFSFGLDPEFMLLHHEQLRSAIEILPKKENAIIKNGHGYYFDNVLAEIAVKPATDKISAIENVQQALRGLARIVNPAKFIIKASGNFPKSEINCTDARVAGCNPEWNVYSMEMTFPPDEDVDLIDGYYQFKNQFRTAGGHIHLGSEKLQGTLEALNVVRMMDLFIGVPSIFLDTDETSKNRRRLYGHAGSYRTPDYGLEYRALSNFWLASPEHVSLIYDLCQFVLDFVEKGNHKKFWHFDEELLDSDDPSSAFSCSGYDVAYLQNCINENNNSVADKFMVFINNYLPAHIIGQIERLTDKQLPDPYEAWELK